MNKVYAVIVFLFVGLGWWFLSKNKSENNFAEDELKRNFSDRRQDDSLGVKNKENAGSARGLEEDGVNKDAHLLLEEMIGRLDLVTGLVARGELISDIVFLWAQSEPEKCLQWVDSLGNTYDISNGYGAMGAFLYQAEKFSLLEQFIREAPPGEYRDHMLVFGIGGVADKDLDLALELAGKASGEGAMKAVSSSIATVLVEQKSVEDILSFIDSVDHGLLRDGLLAEVVRSFSGSDPGEAINFLLERKIYSKRYLESAISSIVTKVVSYDDPQTVVANFPDFNNESIEASFLAKFGREWFRKDSNSASEWLLATMASADVPNNEDMVKGILNEAIRVNPASLFSGITELPESSQRHKLVLYSAKELAKFDPEQAARHFAELVDSDSIDSLVGANTAVKSIARNWIKRDSHAAVDWVNELKNDSLRDVAVEEIVADVLSADRDYDTAKAWTETISDRSKKEKLLRQITEFEENG